MLLEVCSAQPICGNFQLIASLSCSHLLPWSDGPPDMRGHPAWKSVAWPMDEGEVKSGQEERLACLPAVQVLGCLDVHEVPMVIQDLYHVWFPL